MKQKEKHIERLTKGKKSGAKIGSRSIGHRLRKHEQSAFSRAISLGYIVTSESQRPNVHNVWHQYCQIKKQDCWVLRQEKNSAEYTLLKNEIRIFKGLKKDCIAIIKNTE